MKRLYMLPDVRLISVVGGAVRRVTVGIDRGRTLPKEIRA